MDLKNKYFYCFAFPIEYAINAKTKNKTPFTITYIASEKLVNEKTMLLNNAMAKKIPETVLTIAVVLGNLKFIPIVKTNVIVRKMILPAVNKSLFSLVLNAKKP